MIKLDIISGFLGSGKTTLIKKMLAEDTLHEKVIVIENEFGEMGIDGAILKKSEISVTELYSGCICCTLSGDFKKTIEEVIRKFAPERIIIEPSGVGKLSEVIKACKLISEKEALHMNMRITVVDAQKFQIYLKNFGEFFEDQIKNANTIFLSRTESISQESLKEVVAELRKQNIAANIVSTPLSQLTAEKIRSVAEGTEESLLESLMKEMSLSAEGLPQKASLQKHPIRGIKTLRSIKKTADSAHDHSADEIFEAWGQETSNMFSEEALLVCLNALRDKEQFGFVLRGKGIVQTDSAAWVQFDYTLGEIEIKHTTAEYAGKICIIGSKLNKNALETLFFGIRNGESS